MVDYDKSMAEHVEPFRVLKLMPSTELDRRTCRSFMIIMGKMAAITFGKRHVPTTLNSTYVFHACRSRDQSDVQRIASQYLRPQC